MKVNETQVTYSRTVSMRQFEPAAISVTLRAQVDPADDPALVIAKIRKLARMEVEKERTRLLIARKESFDDEREKAA